MSATRNTFLYYTRGMADILTTVTFVHRSGIAAEAVQNSFAIGVPGAIPDSATLGEVTTAIANFYNGNDGGDRPLSAYMGQGLSREPGAVEMAVYNITGRLDGRPHGSPVFTDTMTLGAPQAFLPLPDEVAVVLTLRAGSYEFQPIETPDNEDPDTVPQRPRQRYSGRLYLGPLTQLAGETDTNSRQRPAAELRTALLNSADRLYTALRARPGGPYLWSVWSRKDANTREIEHAQVDNAFDTQRRRGPAPTVRDSRRLAG